MLRVTLNKYKDQAALLKDVLQVQASSADANNQYQQAVLSLWTARADFEKAIGEE
jgi:outer membrane protein TolC